MRVWNPDDLNSHPSKLRANKRAAEWRVPFGTSGILDFFLEVIATQDVDNEMTSQTLRLIGNSCADTGLPFADVTDPSRSLILSS